MPTCFFATDLHGRPERYRALFATIEREVPAAVFLGGDLLPGNLRPHPMVALASYDFVDDFLLNELRGVRERMAERYPRLFVILGNDDPRFHEAEFLAAATQGFWTYSHGLRSAWGPFDVYGYSYIPPTPFLLKDWERYDVSRYVDPGCVSPEEGHRTIPVSEHEARYSTIERDLPMLAGDQDLARAILLFHAPPYNTYLDRAALDGKLVDFAPLDPHVGSMAIRRFIETRQPLVTLHGHIHESCRLTGTWRQQLGRTWCLSAAHDGPELALVRFDPDQPAAATRELI